MNFSISIVYHALHVGEALCYVDVPRPLTIDEVRAMVRVLEITILDLLPGQVDASDAINALSLVLPGTIEMCPNLDIYGTKDFGMGQSDVAITLCKDGDWPECVFHLDPEAPDELFEFLS